jgi:hypothetical protein
MPPHTSNQRSNQSNRSRYSNSSSKPNRHDQRPRPNRNPGRTPAKKPLLQKLLEEYNPPFPLGYKWESKDKVKIKLPNPYVEGDKELLNSLSSQKNQDGRLSSLYQQVLDLENQSELADDDVPHLYHIFRRCLRGQALIDWNSYAGSRPAEEKTIENYSADVDRFIKFHESRAEEDMLCAQKAYMNHLVKPLKKTPSEFRAQLMELNNLITTIPQVTEEYQFSELELKYLFVEAMPHQWRRRFQEVGKKARTEPFDELAQFFDIFHASDAPKSNQDQDSNIKRNSNNRSRNQPSASRSRIQDHTWWWT